MNNKPLKSYSFIHAFLIISLGKYNGMITYKKFVFPGIIAALAK
jgi:hypothetical protein